MTLWLHALPAAPVHDGVVDFLVALVCASVGCVALGALVNKLIWGNWTHRRVQP